MLNILCALRCEAKPLIEHYKLQAIDNSGPFAIWQNESLRIMVCGLGKNAAAAGVGYLAAQTDDHAAWLNLGVGGCGDAKLGQLFWASKIVDAASERFYYPAPMLDYSCEHHTVCSVDKPQADYEQNVIYDMEASAFYETACRFTSVELVQIVKIISDNQQQGIAQVKAKQVEQLVREQLPHIITIIEQLQKLQQEAATIYAQPEAYDELLTRWHFTAYQRKQLLRLLQRAEALNLELPDLTEQQNSKQVISHLQQHVSEVHIGYSS